MMKKKKNNKGFSLVELIVVIAIMAVLVGVLAPQFIGYVGKSRQSTDVQNAQQLAEELAVSIADLEANGTTTAAMTSYEAIPTTGTGVHVSTLPVIKTNASGKQWWYKYDGKSVHVAIAATGAAPTDATHDLYPSVGSAMSTDYPDVD